MATPITLEPAALLSRLESGCADFAALLGTAELTAPVPSCPGWDLIALAEHLGNVHRWVRGCIVDGHPNTPEQPAPRDRGELAAWYRSVADGMLDTLRTAGPQAPCWAFGPKPHSAGFWYRRQAQEVAVHLLDAQQSQGDPRPIDPALALDGVDEVARMFFPRQVRLRRMEPLDRSLALVATGPSPAGLPSPAGGPPPRWVLGGDGTGLWAQPDAEAEATLSGPAEVLLLVLWKRLPVDHPALTLSGDPQAARDVLGRPITP